jgi:hypothetical protein
MGSLAVGKKPNLKLLDRNLFEIDSHDIHETNLELTMMNGMFTYQAGPKGPTHEERARVYPGDVERLSFPSESEGFGN